MSKLTSLCVYCGAALGTNPGHRAAARRLGQMMAARGVGLIYGGAQIGLMGALADAVTEGGGKVTGIIPKHLDQREVGHRGVTELLIVDSMHTRKRMMFDMADAFAILPGGLGTLDETFEMLTWRQLRLHDKPIILVDLDGYWQPLIALVDHAIAEGFAPPPVRRLFTVVPAIEAVLDAIEAQPEPAVPDAPALT
ncbi:MAG: TIGR00730 family Rossman fold protein [Dongiaceae bacterium]